MIAALVAEVSNLAQIPMGHGRKSRAPVHRHWRDDAMEQDQNLMRFRDLLGLPRASKAPRFSRWEWLILVSTAFLVSLAMTSAMAAVLWFAS